MVRVIVKILKKIQEYICPGSLVGIQFFYLILRSYQMRRPALVEISGRSCWRVWVADTVEGIGPGGRVEQ